LIVGREGKRGGGIEVGRLVDAVLGLVRPSPAPSGAARPAEAARPVLPRFLAWRLRVLLLAIAVTAGSAALGAAARRMEGPPAPGALVLRLEPEEPAAPRSRLGELADLAWTLSFYAMPVSSALAAASWRRPRASSAILLAGWAASFLVPVAVALLPWSWWEAGPGASGASGPGRIEEGVAWGLYYLAVLSPAVLALVPGIIRACLRVKSLLPGASLPGWLLMAAAPFHGLLALAAFVALAQVAPGPLLLLGMLLWFASPLAYVARGGLFTRPIATAAELRGARHARALARALALGAGACLIGYATTWRAYGLRLVGLDPETSLLRPWQVACYALDFWGRALLVTVLGADLLLRATLSAWRQQRAFAAGPAADDFDRAVAALDAAMAAPGRGAGADG
jgi:hypothetical protein